MSLVRKMFGDHPPPLPPGVASYEEAEKAIKDMAELFAKELNDPYASAVSRWRHSRYAREGEEGIEEGFGLLEDTTSGPLATTDHEQQMLEDLGLDADHGNATFASMPPTCPKTCVTCLQHYRPREFQKYEGMKYKKVLSDADATAHVRNLVETSVANIEHVRRKLSLHGDAIVKRWQKRNVTKRTKLLLEAKPDLYANRWLACDLFYQTIKQPLEAVKNRHKLWLLPYLEIPTLTEDDFTLFALLHYRTKHAPSEWMLHDSESLKTVFAEGDLHVMYNPHCVVMHGTDYGRMVAWEKESAHRWDIVGFPRAQLILEAQSLLSDFLKKVIDLLVGGEAPEGSKIWFALADADFSQDVEHEIAGPYCDPAFSAPPSFQIDHLSEVLKHRLSAAEDELFLMQTDPAHVREVLERARVPRSYKCLNESEKHMQLVLAMVLPMKRYDEWCAVVNEVQNAVEVFHRYGKDTKVGAALPEEYDLALRMLEQVLSQQFRTQCADLRALAAALPTFEQNFRRCGESNCTMWHLVSDDTGNFRTDKLFWAIGQIRRRQQDGTHDPSWLLKMIDHELVNSSKKGRNRIDQLLHDHLSDMAATDEALSAIRYHRPRVDFYLGKEELDELMKARPTRKEDRELIISNANKITQIIAEKFGTILEEFLAVPPINATKLSEQSVSDFVKIHDLLSAFWRSVADWKMPIFAESFGEERAIAMLKPISVCTSLDYARNRDKDCATLQDAVLKQEEARKQAPSSPKPVRKPLTTSPAPTSPVQTVWGSENVTPSRRDSITPRAKLKTRKSSVQDTFPSPNVESNTNDSAQDVPQPKIEVNAISLALFHRMFTPVACAKGTASVKWDDFVSALGDAGCTSKQAGGSAVTFMHETEGASAVVIHRPHPDPSINPIMLSSFAKKFGRRMGWDKDTFVQRERAEDGKARK